MKQREVLIRLKNLPENTQARLDEKAAITYVDQKISDLVNGAPGALDTLQELAKALGEDPNFATTMVTQLANKSDVGHTHTYAELTEKPAVSYFENDAKYLTKAKDIPNLDILTPITAENIAAWNEDPTWETLEGKPNNFMYQGMPVSDLENDAEYVTKSGLSDALKDSVELAHLHENKDLLDTITEQNWNSKVDVVTKSITTANWAADSDLFSASITLTGVPTTKTIQYVNVKTTNGEKVFVDYSVASNVLTITSTQAYDATVEVMYSTPVAISA